jgi:hypothetical protein
MALQYSSTVATVFTERGIRSNLASAVSIMGGTRPSSEVLISDWTSYNADSSAMLWTATGFVWTRSGNSIFASITPTATPLRNGTASWAILWQTAVTLANQQTSTIPNQRFIIIDVSSTAGDGIMKLFDTSLNTSTPMAPSDVGMRITFIG